MVGKPEENIVAVAGSASGTSVSVEVLQGDELNNYLRKARAEPLSTAIILEKIASAVAGAIVDRVLGVISDRPLRLMPSATH